MQTKNPFNGDTSVQAIESALATDKSQGNGARSAVHQDIEKTLGILPGFMKVLPVANLESEWRLFRDFQLSDQTALTPREKELIGLAVAAVLHCQYCIHFHSVAAGMNGATPQMLNEALLMAKQTAGWSSYLNGLRYDLGQLKTEMSQIEAHVMKSMAAQGGAKPQGKQPRPT